MRPFHSLAVTILGAPGGGSGGFGGGGATNSMFSAFGFSSVAVATCELAAIPAAMSAP